MAHHSLNGKKIDPKPAEPRPGEEAVYKVFVGGIDTDGTTEEDLRAYFEKFGVVSGVTTLIFDFRYLIQFQWDELRNTFAPLLEHKGFRNNLPEICQNCPETH